MSTRVKVFLVDDHRILRDGLRVLLETQGDCDVIGEAENGREAVEGILRLQPDLVLMDITMPDLNGIDAAQRIAEQLPDVRIIILSVHSDSEHIYRAFQAGAQGYLLKESAGSEVIKAVEQVMAGNQYLSAKIADSTLRDYAQMHRKRSPLEMLSAREREVLLHTVNGETAAQVAEFLQLSPKTVETYRSRIMTKLEVSDITELVRFAIKHGIISVD